MAINRHGVKYKVEQVLVEEESHGWRTLEYGSIHRQLV